MKKLTTLIQLTKSELMERMMKVRYNPFDILQNIQSYHNPFLAQNRQKEIIDFEDILESKPEGQDESLKVTKDLSEEQCISIIDAVCSSPR